RGEGVYVGDARVHPADQAGRGEVGEADADRVAVRFLGQVADEDPANVGREAALPANAADVAVDRAADDVRIHATAADVLADSIDNHEVDLLERQQRHHVARLDEE